MNWRFLQDFFADSRVDRSVCAVEKGDRVVADSGADEVTVIRVGVREKNQSD